ncbi:hypothetical protein L9F63_011648, partial [Diploptera punctata]
SQINCRSGSRLLLPSEESMSNNSFLSLYDERGDGMTHDPLGDGRNITQTLNLIIRNNKIMQHNVARTIIEYVRVRRMGMVYDRNLEKFFASHVVKNSRKVFTKQMVYRASSELHFYYRKTILKIYSTKL